MQNPKTELNQRSSFKTWRATLKRAILVCVIGVGVLYVVFTVGTVGYIKYGGSELRELFSPDLMGKSISEIRAIIDTKAFSVTVTQDHLYIRRLANVSGHRCLVSLNENGTSTATNVVFLF